MVELWCDFLEMYTINSEYVEENIESLVDIVILQNGNDDDDGLSNLVSAAHDVSICSYHNKD